MTSTSNTTPNTKQKQLYFKLGFIVLLILLLLIPNAMIRGLIHERQSIQDQARMNISATWGEYQVLAGPIIAIPYTYGDDEKTWRKILYITPENVDMQVDAKTQERQKGIYSTTLFLTKNIIKANFTKPDTAIFGTTVRDILWAEAELLLPMMQPTTVTEAVFAKINGKNHKLRSYETLKGNAGLKTTIDLSVADAIKLETTVTKRGSEYINFVPTGEQNTVVMTSDWASPGFEGTMLPDEREITTSGFTAKWSANEYNRPLPTYWKEDDYFLNLHDKNFGVKMVNTVDHYQKNLRSVKYAILIISLSFLVFFFFEMMQGKRLHPLQYILIGLSLSLFYLLLLSFSEHIGFNMAYIVATLATVGLVTWYTTSILRSGKGGLTLGGILIALYGYIFVLLQMEDYALLAGTVGLFIILAIVMAMSRKMDWYAS